MSNRAIQFTRHHHGRIADAISVGERNTCRMVKRYGLDDNEATVAICCPGAGRRSGIVKPSAAKDRRR